MLHLPVAWQESCAVTNAADSIPSDSICSSTLQFLVLNVAAEDSASPCVPNVMLSHVAVAQLILQSGLPHHLGQGSDVTCHCTPSTTSPASRSALFRSNFKHKRRPPTAAIPVLLLEWRPRQPPWSPHKQSASDKLIREG